MSVDVFDPLIGVGRWHVVTHVVVFGLAPAEFNRGEFGRIRRQSFKFDPGDFNPSEGGLDLSVY